MSPIPLLCAGCQKTPSEIEEYIEDALVEGMSEDDYVWEEEGTLNRNTGKFLCTHCYIQAGMPTAPGGWVVPDGQ